MVDTLKQLFEQISHPFAVLSMIVFFLLVISMLVGQVAVFLTHSTPNGMFRKLIQYLGNFDIRRPDNKPKEYGVKKAEV